MHRMNLPSVILIGGCPGAGKTTLGRAIANQLGYPSLTIDHLLTAVKAVTTAESHPGLHVVGRPNHTEYFTESSVEQLTRDATLQHRAIWPAVEMTIQRHAKWGWPIVIDGWHIRPKWAHSLEAEGVSCHWLVIEPRVLRQREERNTNFLSGSRSPQQMLDRFLSRSLWYNELVETEAHACGHHMLHQDGARSVEDLSVAVRAHFG